MCARCVRFLLNVNPACTGMCQRYAREVAENMEVSGACPTKPLAALTPRIRRHVLFDAADIAKQATKDLGFKVEMSVVDHPGLTNRMVNDPKSIDIADMEIWQSKIADAAGRDPGGRDRQDQELGRPHAALYGGHCSQGRKSRARAIRRSSSCIATANDGKTFAKGKTDYGQLRAGRLQCRHAGHPARPRRPSDHHLGRPDLA